MLSGLESVWEAVSSIPSLIAEKLKTSFTSLGDGLGDIWDSIKALPKAILDGIKDIFVPDTEYIQTAFDSFTSELKFKFNVDTSVFESLFQSEQPVEDVYTDYNISGVGTFNLKVFDKTFFIQGIQYFRPFIRGFLVLMLLLYNVSQLIGFFGYNSGVVQGRSDVISSSRERQAKE